jgi:hypothetical protein
VETRGRIRQRNKSIVGFNINIELSIYISLLS